MWIVCLADDSREIRSHIFSEKYKNKIYTMVIASTLATRSRERSELYGREYDQGKVTCNDIYFQQKSLWPIFSFFFFPNVDTGRWLDWGGLDYTASHKIWVSLISVTKWQETSVNKCHEHILLIIFITHYWFTYIFIYWQSFFNEAVKDFWRDYR